MERIRQAFIKYAPSEMQFVNTLDADTVQCLHYIGQNPREDTCKMWGSIFETPTLPKTSRYILFLYINNFFYPQLEQDFKHLLEKALAVITTTPEIIQHKCNIIETPWGYEPSAFYMMNLPKKWTIITHGHIAESEAVNAIFNACYKSQTSMVHVGGRMEMQWREPTFTWIQSNSDEQLRTLYNQCRYVNALRREPCFELPAIEGYACGCQPICFDHTGPQKYFRDFAIYVPTLPCDELAPHLIEHFKKPIEIKPNPEILKRFYWETIMTNVWKKISEVL